MTRTVGRGPRLRKGFPSSHDKMQGLRECGDVFYGTREILSTEATRLAYEQELRRFLDRASDCRDS
jgi:hypothetical protein